MKSTFLLSVACLLFSLSCNKSGAAHSACRLTTVSENAGSDLITYNLSYDSQGRLAGVAGSGGSISPFTRTFVYSGSHLILVTTTATGSPSVLDSVLLDDNGKVIYVYEGSNGSYNTLTCTRDSQGQLQKSVNAHNGNITYTSTFQYSNGDLTSGMLAGTPFNFTYYPDKPAAITDALSIAYWMQDGAVIYNNRHLVKSYQTSAVTQTFTYSTDASGNISDATVASNSDTTIYHYTYDCD